MPNMLCWCFCLSVQTGSGDEVTRPISSHRPRVFPARPLGLLSVSEGRPSSGVAVGSCVFRLLQSVRRYALSLCFVAVDDGRTTTLGISESLVSLSVYAVFGTVNSLEGDRRISSSLTGTLSWRCCRLSAGVPSGIDTLLWSIWRLTETVSSVPQICLPTV